MKTIRRIYFSKHKFHSEMQIFDINPNIRQAETLASEFYTGEKFFHESKEKIFARSWQFVGTKDEIENLKPHTILENFLDEPILLTKNGDKINCLSNVCTHRGKILIENNCKSDGIRCNYHGRQFDLEGKFRFMPEFELAENFPTEKDDLTKIPYFIKKEDIRRRENRELIIFTV